MTNDNRKTGTSFEQRLCISLSGYGFWAHNLAQKAQGQPFDVIAARNGKTYPIDCKVCEHDIFKLERVEDNQQSSMTLWRDTGNGEGWFALELSNSAVYFISFSNIEESGLLKTVLGAKKIKTLGVPLGKWVTLCE